MNTIWMRKGKSSTNKDAAFTAANCHNGRTNKPPRSMIKRNNQKYAHRI